MEAIDTGSASEEAPPSATEESPNSEGSQLFDEMERPWPATFERSISLLSSPIISAPQADHFTRSPKPGGTPLSSRRAQVRSSIGYPLDSTDLLLTMDFHLVLMLMFARLKRGYLTPEQSSLLPPGGKHGSRDFQKGVQKQMTYPLKC